MANIKITFVLPNDESEASHVMQQAYNSCKEFVKEISWAKEADLKSANLSKGDYLVFEEFSGKDYSQYIDRKCVVISPLAISVCLIEGKPIPNFKWPILSVSLYGCEISCSQLPKNLKESIKNKVQLMGGLYSGDLTDSVTHLICGSSNSDKYRLAVEKGVLLMLPTWIDYVFELSAKNNVNCHDKKILDEYKCPPFYGLTVCATGLTSGEQKTRLVEIIKANGGNFTGTLILSKTDVLICYGTASSEKYKSARRVRSIWCVTPNWIYDSVEKGYAMPHDLEKYRVKTATSTPTKDSEKVDPNFSTISAVGQLSMCQRTRIDETVNNANILPQTKNFKRKADDLVEIISMKKVMGAGHFLDGCSVYLLGFSPARKDKLNKIINMSGATRYDDFSDRVTHVIVGDPISSELTKIKENCAGCHLVTLQWLLDSVDEQKPAEENNYRIMDSNETDTILTKEVINLFMDQDKTTISQNVENDDALTQKYLKAIDTVEDVEDTLAKMLQNQSKLPEDFKIKSFQPQNTSTQISQATTDLSNNESTFQLSIFEGFKFTLQGFDQESYNENKTLITSAGGIVTSSKNCDYAIVPIIYNPKEVLAKNTLNELWLHENLETETLISDIKYYHKSIAAPLANFFSGCVITISSYANFEREFLKSLIIGFGGVFQEQFSRKSNEAKNVIASTHLITPEASGKKYEAALKWNLPVTTKDWLLACVEAGQKLPWQNYSIDNDTLTSNIQESTPKKTENPSNFKPSTQNIEESERENPKTPTSNNFKPSSQVTPINKILQDAINCKVLPTPPSPKQYFPWDPKTPDTPLGWFVRPNPSPGLRKEMQKYVNSFPDFVPPKRRNSTPLTELKKRLLDKVSGRSQTSETNDEIEAQKLTPQRLSFEDTNKSQPNIDNTSLQQKLQDLQKMVQGSANNTPRRSTWIEASSEPLGTQSQICTVNWDYEEEKISNPSSKKMILLSGITDREKYTGLIKSLGAQCLNAKEYVSTATHLICLKPGRNEKTLCCMAAGKWILHVSYLEKSAEVGHFLDEEEFEFGNPKAKKNIFYEEKDSCIYYWRKEIAARGFGAFHDMRAIIIAEKKELLANVVQAGGGAVINVEPPFNDSVHATHCLMEMKSVENLDKFVPLVKQGIKCVNTIYLNDFLWKKQQNDLDCILPYFTKYYK